MTNRRRRFPPVLAGIVIAVVAILLFGVRRQDHRGAEAQKTAAHYEELLAKAKEIVANYRAFVATKVDRDQRQDLGVAPAPCAPPDFVSADSKYLTKPTDAVAFENITWRLEDRDSPLHGRKIYALFAKDELAFRLAPTNEQPVGQAVVKEAWTPKELSVSGKPTGDRDIVHHQGKDFGRGEPRGLFLLFKVNPSTPGTDNGWVYATTAADRTSITACGLLPTCADCHNRGGKDRLFGPVRN